jgi:BTB/POZ domain
MVTVFHKGKRQNGLLRNELRLAWALGERPNKHPVTVFKEEYPGVLFSAEKICNFQIIIESPEDAKKKWSKSDSAWCIHEFNYWIMWNAVNTVDKQGYLNRRTFLGSIVDIQIWPVECCPVVWFLNSEKSKVFAAMFQDKTKEKECGEVTSPATSTSARWTADVTPVVFNKLLQFIFTADCPLKSTEELLKAADKYDIPDLKQFCELELHTWTLNVDTGSVGSV